MRKRNKKKNYFMLLLLLVVTLGIGYALISTNLTINGVGKFNNQNWNVHFEDLTLNPGNVSLSTGDVAATINQTTMTDITFTVTLQKPGDFYEFEVAAVNSGTMDAMVGLITNNLNGNPIGTGNEVPAYARYTATYSDGIAIAPNHLLEAGYSETYKVRLEYRTDIDPEDLPDEVEELSFTFGVQYVQADANAITRPLPVQVVQLPAGRTKDNLQVGDEIIISGETDEYFNFIRYDGDDIVLLAKYNLKVGQIYDSNEDTYTTIATNSTGYGLQSSDARGNVEDSDIRNGVVAFSYTNYWDDNGTPKSKYPGAYDPGPNYPTVYDTDYTTAPDFSTTCDNSTNCFYTNGYSIAYYVEQYKNTLMGTGYGAPIKDARLLTYEEATDNSIGCDGSNNSCPTTGFITNTSFWLGSAGIGLRVWGVDSIGYIDYYYWFDDFSTGVRPVITISKSNL